MKNASTMRKWATPFIVGAFALSAVTGIMLFFKVNVGMIKPVHEWLSWLLVIGTIFHLAANWKFLIQCISSPLGKGIIGVFLLVLCASFIPHSDKQGGPPSARISDLMGRTSLSFMAQVAGHEPDEMVAMLREQGVKIDGQEQSIGDIARMNGNPTASILDMIF